MFMRYLPKLRMIYQAMHLANRTRQLVKPQQYQKYGLTDMGHLYQTRQRFPRAILQFSPSWRQGWEWALLESWIEIQLWPNANGIQGPNANCTCESTAWTDNEVSCTVWNISKQLYRFYANHIWRKTVAWKCEMNTWWSLEWLQTTLKIAVQVQNALKICTEPV